MKHKPLIVLFAVWLFVMLFGYLVGLGKALEHLASIADSLRQLVEILR